MMITDKQLKKWLIEVRRDFHMHPEILFQEVRTTEKIMARLSELGVEHHGFYCRLHARLWPRCTYGHYARRSQKNNGVGFVSGT